MAASPTPERPAGAKPRATPTQRALLVIALVFLLKEAQPLLAPVVIAVLLTFVLAPQVRWLRRHGVPEVAGAALVVVALLASVVPLAATLVEPAAQWWQRAPETAARVLKQIDRLRAAVPGLAAPAVAAPSPLSPPPRRAGGTAAAAATEATGQAPAAPPDPIKERLASEGVSLTGVVLGRGVAFAVSAVATVILLYFLLASEHWLLLRTVAAVPRPRARALLVGGVRAAQREIARFVMALGLVNLCVGVTMGLLLYYLGLPNPLLWAVLCGVLNFIPYIGPFLISGLLLAAGALSFEQPMAMLAPALAFMAVHAVEANLVSPWVVGRQLQLSPLAIFLSVMFWGWLWGIAGAVIAVPMLIGIRSVCRRRRALRQVCHYLDGNWRPPPPSLAALLRVRRRPAAVMTRRPRS